MKYYPMIRSRHPSHDDLRRNLNKLPYRSVVRLGSTTELNDNRIEINTVDSVKKSSNKLLMKACFQNNNVKTADWLSLNINEINGVLNWCNEKYPIVAKHIYGSRGTGNYKLDTREQLEQWLQGKNFNNYIFEKFYSYSREYRLHVTKYGCFYTCRKMLKSDTPENNRWFRNDSNSVWVLEDNELFDKPVNWEQIVEECVKALTSVGLDIGAIDLKVQSKLKSNGNVRENPDFIILETNSAPSFGEITLIKYKEELNKLIKLKYEENK